MEVFVRNIPAEATTKHLKHQCFDGPLRDSGVHVYYIDKHPGKAFATITILDARAGEVFLNNYGVPANAPRHILPLRRISFMGRFIVCCKSRNEPSDFALQSLRYEASQQAKAILSSTNQQKRPVNKGPTRFGVRMLQCGVWEYAKTAQKGPQLAYTIHSTDPRQGHVSFGQQQAIILLGPSGGDQCRIDINYHDCTDINLGTYEEPCVTFNLNQAPRMYEVKGEDQLTAAMTAMQLGPRVAKVPAPKKFRISSIDGAHAKVAGHCWVYRIALSDFKLLASVRTLLHGAAKCQIFSYKTKSQTPPEAMEHSFMRLAHELTDQARYGRRPFAVRFQIERLAKNGLLTPSTTLKLLPRIFQLCDTYGINPILSALRRFARDLQYERPGPGTQASDFSLASMEALMEEYATNYDAHAPDNPYELANRHAHINLVHKMVITPAGTYLEGPEPEPTNRVLRRWSKHNDHFIRVVFQDEDGGAVRYDPRANLERIYHGRFKGVLDQGVVICGRGYSFLGFSHSSLRSQSCWFMAPFFERSLLYAQHILKDLGDFSHIEVPAKCAARIGQAFTDTNASVDLNPAQVCELPVIARNGRDFSDGVGTISKDLLRRVWQVYGTRKLLKPTLLQIRFQGAKGMVSLDSRQRGQMLCLRSNMRKFETKASWNLEICGAGFRPLPMILNRQFIKIFEDLGIPLKVFTDLQTQAIDQLRSMTHSSINTATFLEDLEMTKSVKLPQLIRHLGQIGLDYHSDQFLYHVVEMAVVSKLRNIKYRGRIPVRDGLTLYGIMDETGYLREGEIYVVTERAPDGGREELIKNNVIITRSPALHPGDIQVVNAVNVPVTSPLKQLSNAVVFSQHGKRDLPSQLSGGDLDGDLYNVIWSAGLVPRTTYMAADYPRVSAPSLGRPVTGKDMSDFFVTFMESDQLGMISNTHMQLADQREAGTLDPDCLRLAEMASDAVDFSKTGIPVDIKRMPKHNRCRPDFMTPSPRVVVSEKGLLGLEDEDMEDDDAFDDLDSEWRPFRYYASDKALGHLFRAIDERQFLASMQQEHRTLAAACSRSSDLLGRLLTYVKHWAVQYGVIYAHHKTLATDIQNSYEESLTNILYDYEPSPHAPLSEAEAFAGQILGRQGGTQGKPLRELSKTMRERFETVVEYAVMRITKGDQAMSEAADLDDLYDQDYYIEREFEALPRAVACLEVAVTSRGYQDKKLGELQSFKYVAAGTCLRELERYRITTFGSHSGLPGEAGEQHVSGL